MRVMRILRTVSLVLVLLSGFVPAASGGTKSPSCLKPFVENIVENDVMTSKEKNLFFRTVDGMDVRGKAGTVNALALNNEALASDQVFGIMTAPNNPGFSHLYQDANGMMGAIGDLTTVAADGSVTAVQGFQGELQVLGGNNFAAAAGAEFDIKVAQDAGKANVLSFQKRVTSPSGNLRIYDVETACTGCGLGSTLNENKNWGSALSGASDSRLTDLVSQFGEDIQIHGPTDFDSLHFNFRTVVQGQDSLILDQLSSKFDDPAIISAIGQAEATRLKAVFRSKWPTLVTYK